MIDQPATGMKIEDVLAILNKRRHRGSEDWIVVEIENQQSKRFGAAGIPHAVTSPFLGATFTVSEAAAIAASYASQGGRVQLSAKLKEIGGERLALDCIEGAPAYDLLGFGDVIRATYKTAGWLRS